MLETKVSMKMNANETNSKRHDSSENEQELMRSDRVLPLRDSDMKSCCCGNVKVKAKNMSNIHFESIKRKY